MIFSIHYSLDFYRNFIIYFGILMIYCPFFCLLVSGKPPSLFYPFWVIRTIRFLPAYNLFTKLLHIVLYGDMIYIIIETCQMYRKDLTPKGVSEYQ